MLLSVLKSLVLFSANLSPSTVKVLSCFYGRTLLYANGGHLQMHTTMQTGGSGTLTLRCSQPISDGDTKSARAPPANQLPFFFKFSLFYGFLFFPFRLLLAYAVAVLLIHRLTYLPISLGCGPEKLVCVCVSCWMAWPFSVCVCICLLSIIHTALFLEQHLWSDCFKTSMNLLLRKHLLRGVGMFGARGGMTTLLWRIQSMETLNGIGPCIK